MVDGVRHVLLGAGWSSYGAGTVLRVLEVGEALPGGARGARGFVDAGRAAALVSAGVAEWYDAAANAPEPEPVGTPAKRAAKGRRGV
ncbi:MAG: hypothetical protein BWX64_02475 [Acidobacteria bacterium ADurb.Bin051]|jgi:hypothetical protein|nr:MAG: hypothetical protein BWX64_02475 [Acidobacteria bacterium ADurb.Bin051]